MKKRIVALSLLVIFILTAPSVNANICCAGQNEQERHLLNDNSDDDLKIIFVWGGCSVNALIKNIGDGSLYDIPWEISLWHGVGGCFQYDEGTIGVLDEGEITKISTEIQSKYLMVVEVFLNVGGVRKSLDAWWIGSYIIIGLLGRRP